MNGSNNMKGLFVERIRLFLREFNEEMQTLVVVGNIAIFVEKKTNKNGDEDTIMERRSK